MKCNCRRFVLNWLLSAITQLFAKCFYLNNPTPVWFVLSSTCKKVDTHSIRTFTVSSRLSLNLIMTRYNSNNEVKLASFVNTRAKCLMYHSR